MNLSAPFIRRPVGTTLITAAILLAGIVGYRLLPISSLPNVDFPTISVRAALPGASPETMASAVATPLERQFSRIAGVSEMTSTSTLGSTGITLQFDLDRDIDAASRDVMACINAARGQLPANLPNNPSYRKVNPSDAPIVILTLTSKMYTKPQMYDVASTILQQKLSQVEGVGQVFVGGSTLPGVRVDVNPTVLNHYGLSLEDVRIALGTANANRPTGQISDGKRAWTITVTDQLMTAREYEPLIVAFRNGAPIRLSDVASVTDDVEDVRAFGLFNGDPAISLVVFRRPGANILDTVNRVRDLLPQFRSQIPAAMELEIPTDRMQTIRASLHDTQRTLLVSVALVILVVFVFLRDWRTTLIPSVAVPVSLVGTFGVMHLCGYSLDNLSLMALTIATGFVVDDAIVVIENISRYLEQGLSPMDAALKGASEIGFTVLSITISLVAVFIPILLMGGMEGRLFHEFAVTLSVAIGISLLVSLTTTPMMCAKLLKANEVERHGWLYRLTEGVLNGIIWIYRQTLGWVLRHPRFMLAVTLGTIGLTVYLYVIVPKGFFPQQDNGRLAGTLIADQDTSFEAMQQITQRFVQAVLQDPAVDNVVTFASSSGGGSGSTSNSARLYMALKPHHERGLSADKVVVRLRGTTARIPGASLRLQAYQELRRGGRASQAQFQYTLRGDDLQELEFWSEKLMRELQNISGIADVNSDLSSRGLETRLAIDRSDAARMGVSVREIDNTLYDAFGQRQVSTIYKDQNQYHVVMEVEPEFADSPDALRYVFVKGAGGAQVPLAALEDPTTQNSLLAVNHTGQFPSVTISFNMLPGTPLSDVIPRIERAARELHMPATIQAKFQGTAQAYQESLSSQPLLILAALVAVYIVLGMLYESFIHPLTILSTIPSAGVGALVALMAFKSELNVMSMIGILLLIGIVKKNAILMIDFALEAERRHGKSPQEAIYEACLLRFRPITMTTLAALLGGLPLALGTGVGSELRRPLGIAIVGGLIFSQMLTLYTTPVVYLYLDALSRWWERRPEPNGSFS
jgi:multidrug efflux pump